MPVMTWRCPMSCGWNRSPRLMLWKSLLPPHQRQPQLRPPRRRSQQFRPHEAELFNTTISILTLRSKMSKCLLKSKIQVLQTDRVSKWSCLAASIPLGSPRYVPWIMTLSCCTTLIDRKKKKNLKNTVTSSCTFLRPKAVVCKLEMPSHVGDTRSFFIPESHFGLLLTCRHDLVL